MTTIFDVAFTDIGRFNINDLNTAIGAPTTLVVPADRSIGETAQLVAQKNPNLVIVLDRAEIVCGLIEPLYVQQMLACYRQQPTNSFYEDILKLGQAVAEMPNSFPMRNRPEPYWCEIGQHITSDGPPCPIHP